MPPKVVALRNQYVARMQGAASGDASSGASASTTILEQIKNNQANRGDGEECVFQKLDLDTTVVKQLQDMKEFKDSVGSNAGSNKLQRKTTMLGDSNSAPAIASAKKPYHQHTVKRTSRLPPADGPSIYIPVTTERVRIADMKEALKDEYAARYCEHIGVAPTQQNMALIQKLMPFENCKVTQSAQQNGIGRTERRNNVVIQPCFHAPSTSAHSADDVPYELLTLDLLQQRSREKPTTTTTASALVGSSDVEAVGTDPGDNNHGALGGANNGGAQRLAFDAYKTQFVYPYNLKERFEMLHTGKGDAQVGTEDHTKPSPPPPAGKTLATSSSRRQHHTNKEVSDDKNALEPSSAAPLTATQKLSMQDALLAKLREGGDSSGWSEEQLMQLERNMKVGSGTTTHTAASASSPTSSSLPPILQPSADVPKDNAAVVSEQLMIKEVSQPWIPVEVSEVRGMQTQFVRGDFPFYRFEGRLSESEIQDLKQALVQEDIAELVSVAVAFLFSAYIAPLSPAHASTVDATERDHSFLILCRCVVRFMYHHQRHPLAMEVIPLCILLFRVLVDATFSGRFPTLRRYPRGIALMKKMDCVLRALLDPFGLMSHVVVLETTPQAQKVLRAKRLPTKVSSAATTPLVQFVIGDGARSTEAKRFTRNTNHEVQEGLNELRSHLTPTIRAELLRIVTQEKILRDVRGGGVDK